MRMNDGKHNQHGKPEARQLDLALIEEASTECDLTECKNLLDRGANANAADEEGCTPLIWAVLSGKSEVVELLLQKGAEVNCIDNDGQTPLHIAAITGNLPVARLLLDRGAEVNARDHFGITPLRSAVLNADTAMVDLLTAKGGKQV
jgi:ankyrin repeat protein